MSISCANLCPKRPEAGVEYLGTRDTVSQLPCGCWDSNLGPLEKHSVLLAADPSF